MEEKVIIALEIGSSKIKGAIGTVSPDGALNVKAVEEEPISDIVRYGCIRNIVETERAVRNVINSLELRETPRKIQGVYLSVGGRSLTSQPVEIERRLPSESIISEEIIQDITREALDVPLNERSIVTVTPRELLVDNEVTPRPIGVMGSHIVARLNLVSCRTQLLRNLSVVIEERLGLKIMDTFARPIALAELVLLNEEKKLGCMLVDMGAETTTVSIYKEGHLVYFATLPLGGRHITNDVATLNFLEDKAEEIKISVGNAIARETASTLNMNGVKMQDVSNLIVARAEEIVVNVMEQITYAGLKESSLPRGLVMIGGGSKLNGMIELLEQHTGLPVRRGQLPSYISIEETKSPLSEMVEVASVLYSGAMNTETECLETPGNEDLPATGTGNEPTGTTPEKTEHRQKPKGPSLFGKLKEKLYGMVTGDVEDNSDII